MCSTDSAIIGPGKKTLDEVRVIMLGHQKGEIETCVKQLDKLLEEHVLATQRLELPNLSQDHKRRFRAELDRLQIEIEQER